MNWTDLHALWAGALWLVVVAATRGRTHDFLALALVATFLSIASPIGLAALTVAGVVSWLLLFGARANSAPPRVRRRLTIAFILAQLGVLRLLFMHGGAPIAIGFAFVALRVIHVAVDRARIAEERPTLLEYVRYLAFFPTLIAGPFRSFDDHLRDERRRRVTRADLAIALERILYGFVKIVVLAGGVVHEHLGPLVAASAHRAAWMTQSLDCLRFGLELYFQFAGYSDVAIGLALAAGYRLPENFNAPFLARDVVEFWQRWHITLSQWCRTYIFDPVAARTRNGTVAIFASMIVLGLWHEFNVRYVAWGICHAVGIVVSHAYRARRPAELGVVHTAIAITVTLSFVLLSFALLKSPSLSEGAHVVWTIVTLSR